MARRTLARKAVVLLAMSMAGMHSHAQLITTRGDLESQFRVQWLELKRNTPIDTRQSVQRYAQCVARDIIAQVPDEYRDLDWEVVVFDSDQRNAFVTMFGKVAVFSGILEVADTPDKLAAVLGHEASHLTLDHISERVGRGRLSTIAGAVGSTISGVNSSGVADVIIRLPFQRGQETEADLSGMTYMARAGYNPAAAIELWRNMMKDTNGERPVEWLSTHPDPEYRMGDIARNLSPALVEYNQALDSGVRPNCRI